MDRAEERAGREDVGDQALMRGLDTALPFVRPGLSLSEIGRRSCDRPHSKLGSSPCRGPALAAARLMSCWLPFFRGLQRRGCGPVEPFMTRRAVHSPGSRYAYRLAMTSRLIAQIKADSSRAIAVATTVGRLPLRVSDRKRPHNLICAFQAISRTAHALCAPQDPPRLRAPAP